MTLKQKASQQIQHCGEIQLKHYEFLTHFNEGTKTVSELVQLTCFYKTFFL